MRIVEDRPRSGRELLAAICIQADVKPETAIRFLRAASLRTAGLWIRLRPFISLHVLIAASRAAHNAIRPTHLFDVPKTLLIGGELLMHFPNVHAVIIA